MRITRKLRASWLGSGPRGRWFKSTRPDQIFKNPQETGRVKSRRSLGIAAQIPTLEPSARRFKLRISAEIFEISSDPRPPFVSRGQTWAQTVRLRPKKNDDIVVTLAVHEIHMLLDVLEGLRGNQSRRANDDLMDCAAYAESRALIEIYAATRASCGWPTKVDAIPEFLSN
jgi:hypothetical protein